MNNKFIVVLITVPSKEVGVKISETLVQKKLATCVNIVSPINSLYIWQGKVANDEEVLLIVKSREELFENELIPVVKSVHPYEVPEIIALPIIMGSKDYLDWIQSETK